MDRNEESCALWFTNSVPFGGEGRSLYVHGTSDNTTPSQVRQTPHSSAYLRIYPLGSKPLVVTRDDLLTGPLALHSSPWKTIRKGGLERHVEACGTIPNVFGLFDLRSLERMATAGSRQRDRDVRSP
jgi:predicted acylesterase/phospholipase RssA